MTPAQRAAHKRLIDHFTAQRRITTHISEGLQYDTPSSPLRCRKGAIHSRRKS